MGALHFLILINMLLGCSCWNSDEMEIFDVVEEIGQNFYELMGITQEAELSEVKKAYRSLSKQLHPDKNDAPDADVKFRQLVSVYDILKDDGRRAIYNRVLVDGLPDWRSPIYYYRRARKMSMFEISIIITVVISIAQYLMAWGSYIDEKHTAEEYLMRKYKMTREKRKKKSEDIEVENIVEEELNSIPRPSAWNILPIQLIRLTIFLFTKGPGVARQMILDVKKIKEEEKEEKLRQEEEEVRIKENEERRKEKRAQKKERKRVTDIPDYTGQDYPTPLYPQENMKATTKEVETIPVITGGPWTDEDFSELSKLMGKYPGGTVGRWDIIAENMHRTVYEVTKMSNKVKGQLSRIETEVEEPVQKVKVKTKSTKDTDSKIDLSSGEDDKWPMPYQRALEKALKMYPKGCDQRWDKISNCVPEKSKEECMIRFKFLADKIKKKKEGNTEEENGTEDSH